MPLYFPHDIQDFRNYKELWLLWRIMGRYDEFGNFIPPVDFVGAMRMPKRVLELFLTLDRWLSIMERQKQNNKRLGTLFSL